MKIRSLTTGVVALLVLLTSAACGVEAAEQEALGTTGSPTSTVVDVTTTTEATTITTTTTQPPATTTTSEPATPTTRDRPVFGGTDDQNDGERPTVAEIKKEISGVLGSQADQPGAEEIIDCLAQGYYDSDLPNGVLRKVVTGEDAEVDVANEDAYNQISEDIQAQCTGIGE